MRYLFLIATIGLVFPGDGGENEFVKIHKKRQIAAGSEVPLGIRGPEGQKKKRPWLLPFAPAWVLQPAPTRAGRC